MATHPSLDHHQISGRLCWIGPPSGHTARPTHHRRHGLSESALPPLASKAGSGRQAVPGRSSIPPSRGGPSFCCAAHNPFRCNRIGLLRVVRGPIRATHFRRPATSNPGRRRQPGDQPGLESGCRNTLRPVDAACYRTTFLVTVGFGQQLERAPSRQRAAARTCSPRPDSRPGRAARNARHRWPAFLMDRRVVDTALEQPHGCDRSPRSSARRVDWAAP
ncbi:phenolpthiocerol synthesis type-I polyketide synthase ppsA [Mycobacterium tuberculosis]|uniref:Phenolpthiocerol synthesis type-I polyketide synthase ppsA n=1 Tax=Mycobacterium tuberculosis TaxID=1773 RepID=A0A655F4U3_MYCTX|nr:phenolpthiocerol synthesis type-I polyketide synthase ppsA [Mycobacterium tuberculosis]CKS23886.1 phenolpthiocerol synthesis type-I polyketide synthase ppsA [Mycobacterium tuberculosis]CKS86032.1 phenolpthiocerol synthesis type-I polyketide synthase ppsA [Mycobacterium tuberculosis]CKT23402.1 phenolpthiocerol synthesis type-I polyketide synthase ppsA [Mycobacterium tuberculosis]CKT57266.1 phenolpthiocerol synthesis type-I polyketide synthase ppsA [Mycobacterium tuberculosis]